MVTETRFLRLPSVLSRVGTKRSTLYRWVGEKKFPPPLRIGDNTSVWVESEVDRWIADRIAKRGARGATV